MVLIDKLW